MCIAHNISVNDHKRSYYRKAAQLKRIYYLCMTFEKGW